MTRAKFWILFFAATLVIAGGVSHFASSSPDGLDATTLQGCSVVETDTGEQLTGSCIAQHATDHAMSVSPLADYSIAGLHWSGGLAGILGVLVTLALAGGLFRLIARSRSGSSAER